MAMVASMPAVTARREARRFKERRFRNAAVEHQAIDGKVI
jgi:hypothetical protein